MSRFETKVPLELKSFFDALPKGSYIHSITLDKQYHPVMQKEAPQSIVIEWESEKLTTGYTFAVDYPLNDLTACRTNPSLKAILKKAKAVFTRTDVKNSPVGIVAPKNASHDPQLRTVEAFNQAKAEGKLLEYQGIEPVWLPVSKDHEFTDGYYYRLKPIESPVSQPDSSVALAEDTAG